MGLRPRTARVVREGRERDVDIHEVIVGDMVIVRPGEPYRQVTWYRLGLQQ